MPRDHNIPPSKVLCGKAALDAAKAIAVDSGIAAKPENQKGPARTSRLHCQSRSPEQLAEG
jgi:hypothetical protein